MTQATLFETPAPPARTDRAAFFAWLSAHGIQLATFTQHTYEKGDFTLDCVDGVWCVQTWQGGGCVDGTWVDGRTVVVSRHPSMSDGLLALAAR